MNKYITLGLIIILATVSSVNTISITNNTEIFKIKTYEQKISSFNNTVFAEECTATWCPNCPGAAEALHNIYESGDYSFYYVTLVDDMNPIAKKRNKNYDLGIIKIYAFPTVYFDGGYTQRIGMGYNVEETESEYQTLIKEAAQRTTRQTINMQSSVTWEGNAKIKVTVEITNQGNSYYFGKIRSYVTEIESRWTDYSGEPYHFGFLDYALNKVIFLKKGESKTFTGIFDGTSDHGGQTYPDITSDNIMVISTISNFIPHYKLGYQGERYTQSYFAYYIDQTSAATPI
jgi:thiol-disulfide isomerase/thioredoxin